MMNEAAPPAGADEGRNSHWPIARPVVDFFLDGLGQAADFTFGNCTHNFYGAI